MCLDLFVTGYDSARTTILAEEYENIKHNLKHILQSVDYCGICLNNNQNTMFHVEDLMKLNFPTSCSMEVMMNELFGETLMNNIPSKYVCESCIQSIRQTYHFINKVKTKSIILQSYIEQTESHIEELENILNTDERNNFENTIVVLQNLITGNSEGIKDINIDTLCDKLNKSHDGSSGECSKDGSLDFNEDSLHEVVESSIICEEFLEDVLKVDTIQCAYCDLKFIDKSTKNQHQAVCKFEIKNYLCRNCKVWFSKKNKLLNHIEGSHDVSLHKAHCPECQRGFTSTSGLKRHIERVHERKTEIKHNIKNNVKKTRYCSICPEVFNSVKDLRSHLKTHEPGEMHKCHDCNKEFDSRKTYNIHTHSFSHRRKVDPDTKFAFKCPDCELSFNNKFLLENHKNTEHLKVKPYSCTICSQQFPAEIKLRYHMNRHKGIRQFQCSECSSMFTSASGLKKHGLRYHSDKRPIPCELCEKSFVCQSEYNLHKQRNHSEKLLSCPICETKFCSKANLRPHIQKVHMKGMSLEEVRDLPEEVCELIRDHRFVF